MSIGAITAIAAVIILTIAVPLGAMLFLAKAGGSWRDFLVGAVTFTVFAMVLELILHVLVLGSRAGAAIQGSIWIFGLYGGLAAGIFEETGRFLAFRTILHRRKARITSLAYGIGHGGIEAFLIVGLAMAANLVLALISSRGGPIPSEIIPAVESLLATPAMMFLWSGFERLMAMAAHMAFSILVFASVHTNRRWLYPAAILIHTAINFAAVVSNAHLPVAATELLVLALTAITVAWAARVYKSLPKDE
ncbi:MAG: YhfC family intramembrane metalloprotease [Oscillospiraceae bacterium]|nr:YhfC family intramembrane metalloprotease [Oscillospiraceae bacterium]